MVTKAAENGVERPKRPRPYRTIAQLTQRHRASILSVEIV